MSGAHGSQRRVDELRVVGEIWRALRQVQRVVLCRQLADHGEDRCADIWQFRARRTDAFHRGSLLSTDWVFGKTILAGVAARRHRKLITHLITMTCECRGRSSESRRRSMRSLGATV